MRATELLRKAGLALLILGLERLRSTFRLKPPMATYTACEVAEYILQKTGPGLSAKALQKLLYYCQAWSLAWDSRPLFSEPIKNWSEGPVCWEAWEAYKENRISGSNSLLPDATETVDAVLGVYGRRTGKWLSDLTHLEPPWLASRKGLRPDEKGYSEITQESMRQYYASLRVPPRAFPRGFLEALDTLVDTPRELPNPEDDRRVDARPFLEWLETGEGDPWASSRG